MLIKFENVSFMYDRFQKNLPKALQGINLAIGKGEYICITGPTGSGKSTLIQHINGLIKPTEGKILIDGAEITYKRNELKKIREKVGLLFQFPEDQLFEDTIEKDICFGPKKLGFSPRKITTRLKRVMDEVGLPYEQFKDQSPMKISGGQKRRVALACTLITEPEVLILDEPTVGLDPRGKEEILKLIYALHKKGRTVIMVTHDMEDIAEYATRLIIMNEGKIIFDDKPEHILTKADTLAKFKISSTEPFYIADSLSKRGWNISSDVMTWDSLEKNILSNWQKMKEKH